MISTIKERLMIVWNIFLALIQKKKELESRGDEEQQASAPQLTKTEGRFETYTGKNINQWIF